MFTILWVLMVYMDSTTSPMRAQKYDALNANHNLLEITNEALNLICARFYIWNLIFQFITNNRLNPLKEKLVLQMGHLSVYQRMFVWGIGTLVAIFGIAKTTLVLFSPRVPIEEVNNLLLYVFLFVSGMVIIVSTKLSLAQGKNNGK